MIERQIRHLVTLHNRQLMMEAIVGGTMGVIFVLVTAGFTFWLTWIAVGMSFGWMKGVEFGFVAVGLYLLVATWSAWRGVSPTESIDYDPEGKGRVPAGMSLATGLPIMDRYSLAGAGAALIAGPASIFEAIADFRRRLPHDHVTIDAAESILRQASADMPVTDQLNRKALVMLQRLALIKVRSAGDQLVMQLTAKGRTAQSAGPEV